MKSQYPKLFAALERGESFLIIKPRQIGMTTFAAKYAAWLADYRDRDTVVFSPNAAIQRRFFDIYDKSVVRTSGFAHNLASMPTKSCLHVFDEIDLFSHDRLDSLRNIGYNQILAYTSILDMRGIVKFLDIVGPNSRPQIINWSDKNENEHIFRT